MLKSGYLSLQLVSKLSVEIQMFFCIASNFSNLKLENDYFYDNYAKLHSTNLFFQIIKF
jgi:hypothetical protein